MFAGAPKFEVKGNKPKVSYRWKLDEEIGQPKDFVYAGHVTFAAATLGRRESSKAVDDLLENDGDRCIPRTVDPDLVEVPNMISLNGSEPGTVGLEYYLQMPVSDSKRYAEDDEDDIKSKRQLLATSPERLGLKPLDLENIIDRLSELGDARESRVMEEIETQRPNEQKAAELYAELFSKVLTHPRTSGLADAPNAGLDGQIIALARVLDLSGLWYDFSLVENRIRLGQLLWPSWEDDESILNDEEPVSSERDIVLLQITLACEMLIRVELCDTPMSTLSQKMRWDLVLAQRFLENVRVAPKTLSSDERISRNSVMSIASFVTARENPEEQRTQPILYPRHEKRQVEGLLAFADALAWPHKDEICERFAERVRRHSRDAAARFSIYGAPPPSSTPSQPPTAQTNYFSSQHQKRPQVNRTATAQSLQLLPASAYSPTTFDLGGWLSRSWLTGLILPGESSSHILISTLLENSPAAVAALGDAANLYQGFIYKSRSYWSKSCILGKVMAASNGATDCMGWIACDWAPLAQEDGWVNIEVKEPPPPSTPALQTFTSLASSSAFLRGEKSATDADFDLPTDGLTVLGNETRFSSFSLLPTGTSFELTATTHANDTSNHDQSPSLAPLTTSIASLTFSPPCPTSQTPNITLPLLYDVNFVSATPCFPSSTSRPSTAGHMRETSGATAAIAAAAVAALQQQKELPTPPTHPLHVSYPFQVIPAASILGDEFSDTAHLGEETVILDSRGGGGGAGGRCKGDLELLARAWCAKVGVDAVIGRVGKTCVACCVREAVGLGIKVVIRVS